MWAAGANKPARTVDARWSEVPAKAARRMSASKSTEFIPALPWLETSGHSAHRDVQASSERRQEARSRVLIRAAGEAAPILEVVDPALHPPAARDVEGGGEIKHCVRRDQPDDGILAMATESGLSLIYGGIRAEKGQRVRRAFGRVRRSSKRPCLPRDGHAG